MKRRIITGVVALLIVLPFFIFSGTPAFTALMAFGCFLGAYELLHCVGLEKKLAIAIPSYLFAVGLPVVVRHITEEDHFFRYCAVFGFIYLFLLLTVTVFSKGRFPLPDVMVLYALLYYTVVGLTNLLMLRDVDCGQYIYLLAFLTAWGSDTFAYFCGRAFGRHKLIPEVSPNKTVEGAVGGFVCCIGLTLLYGFIVGKAFGVHPHYGNLAIAGAVMSAVSMVGDLIMSAVKRHYGIKDFGKILPGHGGILDRVDSVLVTAPFLYILYTVFNRFALFTA